MTTTSSARQLAWLERPPADLRARLRILTEGNSSIQSTAFTALARTALSLDQLVQVDRALARAAGRIEAGTLSTFRLAILADGTVDYLVPAVRATGLRYGFLLETYAPSYGQALQEALDPTSPLANFRPNAALIASDHRTLGLSQPRLDPVEAEAAVTVAAGRLGAVVEAIAHAGITPIIQTVPVPSDPWCGHLDASLPGSPAAQVAAVNARLLDLARRHSAPVLDADSLAALVGREAWFDAAYWHRAKIPFALEFLPLWADHLSRILGALRGKSRKCLVLDLDNTCWGGVIGDDGLEGIRLGQGSADGEAFLAIQAYALSLKARGVVLAVVSKNEDDAARSPFRSHPEMLLKEEDIAVFLADWNDKATNIRHVAERLNIGLDALAFLDDNPAERARVRQMLPEVAVPEVPDDPSLYPSVLAQSGFFEAVSLSANDAKRAEQYRQNAERAVALERIGDYDTYLTSLAMTCEIEPFDTIGRTRIAQLINKSNQFNLTTRRYTEAEVARIEADPDTFGLQIRLMDAFGDNGMISVLIARKGPEEWVLDTWLMSCRVLGRRVEEAVLAAVASAARNAGAHRLVGEYLPTAKNRMVARHYDKLGFHEDGRSAEDGPEGLGTRWVLELHGYAAPTLPMTLTGSAAPLASAAATV